MSSAIHFNMGRFLVIIGIVLVVLGLMVMAGSKFSFFGLGRLPGDITYKGKNIPVLFPNCDLPDRERRFDGGSLDHFLFDEEIVSDGGSGFAPGQSKIANPESKMS